MAYDVVPYEAVNPYSGLSGLTNRTCRVRYTPDAVIAGAGRIRILLSWIFPSGSLSLSSMYVGHKGVGDYDFDGSQVQVRFLGGSPGVTLADVDLWSDWVDYDVDETKDLIISFFLTTSVVPAGATSTTRFFGYSNTTNTDPAAHLAGSMQSGGQAVFVLQVEGEPGPTTVLSTLDQPWSYSVLINQPVVLSWGLRMGVDLLQPWSDAPVIKANLYQPYGNAGVLTSALLQRWRDAVPLRQSLNQPYALTAPLVNILRQPWALTADPVQALLAQGWNIADINQVVAVLQQNWWGDFDPAVQPLETVVTEVIEGSAPGQPLPVSPTSLGPLGSIIALTVEASLDQYVISVQLQLHSQADYLLCEPGSIVTLAGVLPGLPLTLRVDSRSRNRSGSEVDTYSVELLSPAAWLDAPYAEPTEGEYSGMASAIATQVIAGALPLSWETVDWYIGEGILAVENRTPLAVIRELAAAVGAVVQSSPDGTIRVISRYKVPVSEWGTVAGTAISEATSITQSRDTFEFRPGYNSYRIADEENVSDSSDIRFTVEDISDHTKQVRAQIPDLSALTLTHTGGNWVIIEQEGRTLTNVEEDEIVEIVSGEGRTRNTIFALTSSAWKHTDLGVVGFEASGLITAAVDGESLLSLDYSYEEQTWKITSPEIEKVQFILEKSE